MTASGEPINVADYERLAGVALDPAALGFLAGGACDERTMRDNLDAFGRWSLRPRVLVDVSGVSATTTVLGTELSMPLLVAPVALQRLFHPDGELATARACAGAGTVLCLSTFASATPAETAATGAPLWFQLYAFADAGLRRALVELAVEAGCTALVLTADTPVHGRRERDRRTGFAIPSDLVPSTSAVFGGREITIGELAALVSPALTWRDLERLAAECPVPVAIKGVLTAEDAALACEHGAAAVIVSNHGGRQLDGVPASLDALPEVAEAVAGRADVLLDGGVRRGTDVLIALGLGARAVLVGRPPIYGLAAAGEDGVRHVLELLRAEIENALALLGCSKPDAVTRAHVARRMPPHA